jgi:hypothetical protein
MVNNSFVTTKKSLFSMSLSLFLTFRNIASFSSIIKKYGFVSIRRHELLEALYN